MVAGTMRAFFVGTRSAHVGQLLAFGHIHHQVFLVDVFSYDLSCIDCVLRFDEELASVLQVVDGVGESVPLSRAIITPLLRR